MTTNNQSGMLVCPKCKGNKLLPQYMHVEGGVCFLCNGLGVVARDRVEAAPSKTPATDQAYYTMRDAIIRNVINTSKPEIEVDPFSYVNYYLIEHYQVTLPGLVAKRMSKHYHAFTINHCNALQREFKQAQADEREVYSIMAEREAERRNELALESKYDNVYDPYDERERRLEEHLIEQLEYDERHEMMMENGHSIP